MKLLFGKTPMMGTHWSSDYPHYDGYPFGEALELIVWGAYDNSLVEIRSDLKGQISTWAEHMSRLI